MIIIFPIKRIFSNLFLFALILVSIAQSNFNVLAGALSLDQISLDFISSDSKDYITGDKLTKVKNSLIRKINAENLNDRDFEITNVSKQNSLDIVSLSNLLPSDIIQSDDSEVPVVNKKVICFNIFIFETAGQYSAKLDTENLNSNFSTKTNKISSDQQKLLNTY